MRLLSLEDFSRHLGETFALTVNGSKVAPALVQATPFPMQAHALGARTDIFDYIETFYNTIRRHSALGNLSPRISLNHSIPIRNEVGLTYIPSTPFHGVRVFEPRQ